MLKYKRDGRSPLPKDERTSKVMQSNKAKNTGPELRFRRALREAGLSGYRLHWSQATGRPDISYPGKKIAIFVNGCFWHGCERCRMPIPKSHNDFWRAKLERNKKRDIEKTKALISDGWTVLTIWECEMERDINSCIDRVRRVVGGTGK